ncbi:MAG: hypothetical protein LBR82_02010 [Desulfovibrio sp.]|nr:hypothetical protein [Desulfovibrio sp.]
MPRLTSDQWEQARAEYEVRGLPLLQIADRIGVDVAAVHRKSKKEAWVKGKSQSLVERKVTAVKELLSVDAESQKLPLTFRHTIDTVVREQLEEAGELSSFSRAIIRKGHEILRKIEKADEWETMTRGKRNLSPPAPAKGDTTTVNVQANAQAAAAAQEPRPRPLPEAIETMRRLLRGE